MNVFINGQDFKIIFEVTPNDNVPYQSVANWDINISRGEALNSYILYVSPVFKIFSKEDVTVYLLKSEFRCGIVNYIPDDDQSKTFINILQYVFRLSVEYFKKSTKGTSVNGFEFSLLSREEINARFELELMKFQ